MAVRFAATTLVLLTSCGGKTALDGDRPSVDAGAEPERDSAVPRDHGSEATDASRERRERCGGGDEDGDGRIDEGYPLVPVGESQLLWTSRERPGLLAAGSTGEDLVVAWQMGLDGAQLRWVDAELRPLGEPRSLPSVSSLHFAEAERALLTYCEPDPPALVRRLVGAAGELEEPLRGSPPGVDCTGFADPVKVRSVMTDRALLTGVVDSSSSPDPGLDSWLVIGEPDGASAEAMLIGSDARHSPALAVAHGMVLHVTSTLPTAFRSRLRVQGYSLDGVPLGEPSLSDAPGDDQFGQPWIVPTPDGFFVVAETGDGEAGALRAVADRSGRILESSRSYPDLIRIRDVYPIPSGALMAVSTVGGTEVMTLDFAGRAETQWLIEDVQEMSHPRFVGLGEELFVAFFRIREEAVETRIQRLGCER